MNIVNIYIKFVSLISHRKQKIIVFNSKPDYSDNSRALSEYLQNQNLGYKCYWIVEDARLYQKRYCHANVEFLSLKGVRKFKAYRIMSSASYIFTTHAIPYYQDYKRKGQKIINLWHGCSYKDRVNKELKGKDEFYDKFLVAGPLFVKTKSYFFRCDPDRILAKGYPRYDWFLKEDPNALRLYNDLLGTNKKLIIWMPTVRNDKGGYHHLKTITQFPLMSTNEDWKAMDMVCETNKVSLVVKLHASQSEYDIPWSEFHNIIKIDNSIFDKYNTVMYSFLAYTDGLISDYSSIAVDYMIVDKPIAFALDDYELYKDARGFVVDNPLDYMPGNHLYNTIELENFIEEVSRGTDIHKADRDKLFDTLVYRSNNYCNEIAKELKLI